MAIAEFELGFELDSAGESIPEIFLILLGCAECRTTARTLLPTAKGCPVRFGIVRAGAMNLIRQRVIIFVGGFFPRHGLGVDLAGPLTALPFYYRGPRGSAL